MFNVFGLYTSDYSILAANASQIYTGQNVSSTATVAASHFKFYQHTFVSGIIGCLAMHMIPTFLLANISICVTLHP